MPYSYPDNVPEAVAKKPVKAQRQYIAIWNSAYSRCMTGEGADSKKCEVSAFKQANGVVLSEDPDEQREALVDFIAGACPLDPAEFATKSEDGKGFSASDYAYVPEPDNPSTWKLRLTSTPGGEPDSGIVGAAAAALGPGFRGQKVQIPDADRPAVVRKVRTAWRKANPGKPDGEMPDGIKLSESPAIDASVVAFAGTTTEAGDMVVVRRGLIFRAGSYKDKDFEMDPAELAHRAAEFRGPVPLDVEHIDTIFDGHLGELRSVEVGPDGVSLYGEVALSKWLHDLIGDAELKVSTAWDRATRQIKRLALVLDPRVEDAALLAAFTEFAASKKSTPHGQGALQMLHDVSARAGAVCPSGDTKMTARHESNAIQEIHDLAAKHGASHLTQDRESIGGRPLMPMYANTPPQAGDAKESDVDEKQLKDRILAAFGFGGEAADPKVEGGDKPPVRSEAEAELERTRVELRRAQDAAAQMRAEKIEADAVAFADGLIREHRAFPAQRAALLSAYTVAATDDLGGLVKMSDGKHQARVDQLRAVFETGPKHVLAAEQVATDGKHVLLNLEHTPQGREGDAPTRERIDELVAHSSVGREMQAERKQNGKN